MAAIAHRDTDRLSDRVRCELGCLQAQALEGHETLNCPNRPIECPQRYIYHALYRGSPLMVVNGCAGVADRISLHHSWLTIYSTAALTE